MRETSLSKTRGNFEERSAKKVANILVDQSLQWQITLVGLGFAA